MKAFRAFFRKELCEAARTHKLTVLGLLFLLYGILNPLTAKLMPDILATALPEGMSITLPEPSALDSWAQFFKNISQMGLIVVVILLGGIMAGELNHGTLVHLLTKGLPRRTVILAKVATLALLWTAAYLLCFGVTAAYTAYFWPDSSVSQLAASMAGLWLFGLLMLSTLPLGGVCFHAGYGSLLFAGGFLVLLYLLQIPPALQPFNPLKLASDNMTLLSGQLPASVFLWPAVVSGVLIAGFTFGAIQVFNRKSL